MRIIKAKHNQTIADIALQEYGDVEGVFFIVEDNPTLLGITDNLHPGEEIQIRDVRINGPMKEYLSQNVIATAEKARGEGIGYWKIENDFIVS